MTVMLKLGCLLVYPVAISGEVIVAGVVYRRMEAVSDGLYGGGGADAVNISRCLHMSPVQTGQVKRVTGSKIICMNLKCLGTRTPIRLWNGRRNEGVETG